MHRSAKRSALTPIFSFDFWLSYIYIYIKNILYKKSLIRLITGTNLLNMNRKNTILQCIIKPLSSYLLQFSDIVDFFKIFCNKICSRQCSFNWLIDSLLKCSIFLLNFFSDEPSFLLFLWYLYHDCLVTKHTPQKFFGWYLGFYP